MRKIITTRMLKAATYTLIATLILSHAADLLLNYLEGVQ